MMNANERQVGGAHYQSTVQHWDFAAAHFGRGYFKGQVTKYVARWRKKNGVQDLQKALHFLEKLIEIDTRNAATVTGRVRRMWRGILLTLISRTQPVAEPSLSTYLDANRLSRDERYITTCVVNGDLRELQAAAARLRTMLLKNMVTEDDGATAAYVDQDRLP